MTNKGGYYHLDVNPLPLTITERRPFVLQNCYSMRTTIFNNTLCSSLRNISMFPTKPIVPSSVTSAHRVKQCHRPTPVYGQKGRWAIVQGDERDENCRPVHCKHPARLPKHDCLLYARNVLKSSR
jgi:hypothetical protein